MMFDLESMREMFGGLLAQVCLSALLLIACGSAIAKLAKAAGGPLGGLWRKSRSHLVALALFACCTTLDAQKTNTMLRVIHRLVTSAQTVSEDDIARSYRQESATTNAEPFAEMPSNAVEYAQWAKRGGRETSFPLDLRGFVFPLGTNRVSRFDVLSGGAVEPLPRGASTAIYAAREYASLVPGVSRFWSADAEDGAKVLRWERVFANRDRTGEYTAEMRFFQNGDFTTRSNEVETAYRRVNPDDWDDDGIANDVDANPLFCNGDFYGVANMLPSNANTDAYYWLDVCATGALGVATIRVTCDGASDLGDHLIIARTNDVCHIPLLAGATYAVESDLPIADSAVSSEHAEIATNSATSLTVFLPLELSFERVQTRGGSDRYIAHTTPIDVGPRIVDISGECCSCVTNDLGFSWSCSEGCDCGGYWHHLAMAATWEGYSRPFTWPGWCPCVWHDDGGQHGEAPRLVLNMPRTLFTNNDGGAEPSDVVRLTAGLFSPVQTNGTLTLDMLLDDVVAIWQNSNRTGRVTLPMTWDVASEPVKELYVEGLRTMPRGLAWLQLGWNDEHDVELMSTFHNFAVYSPNLNVINSTLFDNGDLCNPSGIVVGTNACFALEFDSDAPPASEIVWSIAEGNAQFVGGNIGERVRVASGVAGQRVKLRVQIDDCRSRQPEVAAYVVDPLAVKLTVWIVGDDYGTYYASDASTVSNLVSTANKIYEQVGVSFYVDSISFTNRTDWLDISGKGNFGSDRALRRTLVNIEKNTGGLELYFVDQVAKKGDIANHDQYGIVLSKNASSKTLAHEIGHAFGCADVYPVQKLNHNVHIPDNNVAEWKESMDWSNGTGCRYYETGVGQEEIIRRLLMCGQGYQERYDLPLGSIYGFAADGVDGLVDVGFFRSGSRRSLRLHK